MMVPMITAEEPTWLILPWLLGFLATMALATALSASKLPDVER